MTAQLDKALRRDGMLVDIIDNHCIAMQAAVIDGHLQSPSHGMQWIVNTLMGPGLLPDLEEAKAMGGAQAWFDAKTAESDALRRRRLAVMVEQIEARTPECHGLDTPECVRFYERDFYVLSNFSAFSVQWGGHRYPTSEHVYHVEKFRNFRSDIADLIAFAPSAHEAFKIAERHKADRRPDWDQVKVPIMREILRAKAQQHEYVRRKLLATGERELVEDSWRDDFWGWGPNRDGQNMLGRLWMEVRAELRPQVPAC